MTARLRLRPRQERRAGIRVTARTRDELNALAELLGVSAGVALVRLLRLAWARPGVVRWEMERDQGTQR